MSLFQDDRARREEDARQLAERAGGGHGEAAVGRLERGASPGGGALFLAWLENHRIGLGDSLRRLIRQPIGSFLTCLVMAIALSLPMGLSMLLDNLERLGGSWQRAAQISVYLKLDSSEEQSQALRKQVAGLPEIVEVQWIGRQQALEEFQRRTGLGQALRELPENPLPDSLLVTPKVIDQAGLEALRQRLAALPGVDQVKLDLAWVERLDAILALGQRFVLGLGVLLGVALLLVVGNTIRLHFESRRAEIEVIKLVGGTDGYVRRPFLYMGALYGLLAGLLAWGLLAFGLDWLNRAVVRLAGLYDSDFSLGGAPLHDGLILVAGAMLLGYAGAWLAVGNHLRKLAPQ